MTQIQRRMAWQEAREKLKLFSHEVDWPECLGLRIIGGLNNPDSPAILENVLRAAADAGELAVSREIQQTTRIVRTGGRYRGSFVGFESSSHQSAQTKSVEERIEIVTARAADVAHYLNGSGLDLSPLLLAWLAPYLAAESGSESDHGTNNETRLTPMSRKAIISTLENQYPSLKADFNRPEKWVKECNTGEHGKYYLEKIKAGCIKKWGDGKLSLGTSQGRIHRLLG